MRVHTFVFENLVNYDKCKTKKQMQENLPLFENLVNYDKCKTSN